MHEQEMIVFQIPKPSNSAREVTFAHSAVSESFPRTAFLVDFFAVGVERFSWVFSEVFFGVFYRVFFWAH